MAYVLYFFSLFSNGFLAYTKKHSKLIVYITMISVILIYAGNVGTLDNINYIVHYKEIQYGILPSNNSEFGFVYLMQLGNKLGLDWVSFKLVMSIICVPLIYSTVKMFSSNLNFVYFFYLIHSFFMDAEQFRNFIALSIFIYAVRFLLSENRKSKVFYILCILIATSIHNSFIFYVPLIFINGVDKNKLAKGVALFSLILCLITFLNGNEIPLISSIIMNLGDINSKILKYVNSTTRYGFLIPFYLHTFNFFVVYTCRKYVYKSDLLNAKQIKFINLIFWINVFAFAFFPLYMKTTTFYRLSRNLNILNFIVFSICNDALNCNHEKKVYLSVLVFLNVGSWFIYDLLIRANEVLIPIFTGNLMN